MGGRVSNLSSLENSRGDVELRGSSTAMRPSKSPVRSTRYRKIFLWISKAVFKNMDLSPMTPLFG